MSNNLRRILKLPSVQAAPLLLGWVLVRDLPQGQVKGIIVETEAYHQEDPASHSFRGRTKRTEPMFLEGGHLYVYFTYGIHYCLNIVTGLNGVGEAVLIRALEPTDGVEVMKINRNTLNIYQLTNGPGKLTQAFGIKNTEMSSLKLGKNSIYLLEPPLIPKMSDILTSPRIGIKKAVENHWRFFLKNSEFVSRK